MSLRTLTVVVSCTRGKVSEQKQLILPLTREHLTLYADAILSGTPDAGGWRTVALRASAT